MTSREVFLETCRFGSPKRAYRLEALSAWRSTQKRWGIEGGPPAHIDFHQSFGMDRHLSFLDFEREFGVVSGYTASPYVPAFRRKVLSESSGHIVVRTRQGIIQRELRDQPERSMPQFLQYPVSSRRDWERIQPRLDPNSPGRYPRNWQPVTDRCARRDFVVGMPLTGAFGHPRNLFGTDRLLTLYYDDPGLVHDVLHHWVWMYRRILDIVTARLQLDYVLIWEDLAYKTAPLISPDLFRTFVLPYYRELTDHIRHRGIDLIFVDTDGSFEVLIPLFLEGGINGFLPFEVAAGMDVVRIRREYGRRFVMIGGVDKRAVSSGYEAIDLEVAPKVQPLLAEGGYIPSMDHSVPPDVSLASFVYYVNVVRAMGDQLFGSSSPLLPPPRPHGRPRRPGYGAIVDDTAIEGTPGAGAISQVDNQTATLPTSDPENRQA